MTDKQASDYEELPYTNNAFPSSHPVTLATIAALYGFDAPNPDSCRVLELGCGRGGNLLPMAEGTPDGEFVGIDLSPSQIQEANVSRDALQVKNVVFHTMDLCDIDRDLGTFDFVVAHGVYAWVPPHVQDQLLRVCAENLSPNGLAYISYNTYPGWHYRGVVRDLLNHFVDRDVSAKNQVAQSRQLLDIVVNALPDKAGIRTKLVVDEIQALMGQADGYVFHDHLEPNNRPCYFHQFITHAEEHGLKYLAEAQVNPLQEAVTRPDRETIQALIGSDRLQNEQLTDFLIHRTFRRSILCKTGCTAKESIQPARLRNCYVISCSHTTDDPLQHSPETPLTFVTRAGDSMTTNHPLVKLTLFALQQIGPQGSSFYDLARSVSGRLNRPMDGQFESELAGVIVATYHRGAIQLRLSPAPFFPLVSAKPLASAVAQWQAKGDSRVTNREHRSIDLNPIDRLLLVHMNGNRDIESLEAIISQKVRAGEIEVKGFSPSTGAKDQDESLNRLVESRCRYLADNGFLIG